MSCFGSSATCACAAEALTARQRQLLRMNFEQNKTVTEIAQELGVNKSTVSRTLLRAQAAALSMPALRAVVRA